MPTESKALPSIMMGNFSVEALPDVIQKTLSAMFWNPLKPSLSVRDQASDRRGMQRTILGFIDEGKYATSAGPEVWVTLRDPEMLNFVVHLR